MTSLTYRPGDVVRILLVEDSDGDARLVELMLIDVFGPTVELTRARSLVEAFECVDTAPADCILLDLGLPDACGLEAVQRITERAPTMPVVVFTGQTDVEIGLSAVALGAQDYLVKGNAVDETLGRAVRYAVVRKHAEDELLASRQTLAEAQRIAQLGSWDLDLATDTMVWSEELYRLYGRTSGPASDMGDLLGGVHPEDRTALRVVLSAAVDGRTTFDVNHRIVLLDGTTRWLRSRGHVELDSDGVAVRVRGTAQDISEQKTAEAALTHQTLHDPLTGLPNRVLLHDRLAQALTRIARSHSTVGLLFVDIDRFKVVNDSLGHQVGDQMLKAMATRLQTTLRVGDTLARFGGDEFVILCEGLTGELEAVGLADRISEAMTTPLACGRGELTITVSTGIALASSSRVSAESLLRDADAAMYRAKAAGRARSAVFGETMRTTAIGRLNTEVSLRQAIVEGELEMHYQPIVELPSRRIAGMEALVRWRHPVRGLIPPDQFIPIAEETGLIVPLGAWVLRTAVEQASAWRRLPGHPTLQMAVNLSGCQIEHPDIVELVSSALGESGLAPHCLELEITESVLMKDAAAAVKILEALKALGVRLSVDDFGTGFSSLSYLKRFPVDVLKIDKSFVDGLGEDSEDTAIVTAITSLAAALHLTTVAEGVEAPLQMEKLIGLGCQRAQGFYFARPAVAAEIDVMLGFPLPAPFA
ncbi:MAG: EAL domain-containing protein [Acidimicrobiales bacterium]